MTILVGGCGGDGSSEGEDGTAPQPTEATTTTDTPTVAELDPAVVRSEADYEQRATKKIPVAGSPDFLTVDYGAVWVGNGAKASLDRIDPATNKVVARIPVVGESCTAIASGFGSIWVPVCGGSPAVVRVDAKKNRVAARIGIGDGEILPESGIGVDESGAWIVTSASGELSRIDPKTNKIAARYAVAEGSSVVTTGFGAVWVANSNTNAVQRVDPASGEILATIPVGEFPRFMAVGEGAVWVTSQSSGDVFRIDPEANEAIAAIDIGYPFDGGDIEAGLGSVWAATGDGPLSRIDPATNDVVEHYEANGADAIGAGEGAIWISDHDVHTVFRLAPNP